MRKDMRVIDQRFKKTFSVIFAILVGASIIFFALKGGVVSTSGTSSASGTAWQDALSVVPEKYPSKTLGVNGANVEIAGTDATTTTDLVARRLLLEYAAVQNRTATTTVSDTDAQNIANTLASQVNLPQEKQYSSRDLNISQDNSHDAYLLYTGTLNPIVGAHMALEKKENELTILLVAMETKDATTLSKLKTKAALYQELIKKLLAIKTPSSLAPIHLHLIQSFEALRTATIGLQSMLADPAVGISALAEYRSGYDGLNLTEQEYADFFAK